MRPGFPDSLHVIRMMLASARYPGKFALQPPALIFFDRHLY